MANNNEKKDKGASSESSTSGEKISDTLKKIISSGSPTEISKEIFGTVLGQALKAKDDITLKVSNEMISLIRKIDFVKEFSKFAQNHKFKIVAEIEITKKEDSSDKN
jgi:hypothetical protein